MSLKNLTHVHTRRYAKRIEHDIDRLTFFIVWHIFDRHDHRDNTFVTMASCHFVTRLNATFNSKIDLYDLKHAWGEIVALG